jgi:hypothetical protein
MVTSDRARHSPRYRSEKATAHDDRWGRELPAQSPDRGSGALHLTARLRPNRVSAFGRFYAADRVPATRHLPMGVLGNLRATLAAASSESADSTQRRGSGHGAAEAPPVSPRTNRAAPRRGALLAGRRWLPALARLAPLRLRRQLRSRAQGELRGTYLDSAFRARRYRSSITHGSPWVVA